MHDFMTLTRPQKAAVILVAMGKSSAGRLLKFFKPDELRALVDAARMLRTVPQNDLEMIVAEFEEEFTEGAGLMDGADQMGTLLTETLGQDEVNAIFGIGGVTGPGGPPPVWPELERLEPARLTAMIATEHPQTAALILSQIAPQAAAAALLPMEKAQRGEIIKRMMGSAPPAEAALKLVDTQLRRKMEALAAGSNASAGQIRVASMLNELDKEVLDTVMQDLEEAGAPDLAGLRSKLFSFEDILALPQKARLTLFDGLSGELVTMALRNADSGLTEAVLSSIGARSRRMIEAELAAGAEGIAPAEISKARKSIASTAIRMASDGALALPTAQAA